jgi:hypothetical protein
MISLNVDPSSTENSMIDPLMIDVDMIYFSHKKTRRYWRVVSS